MGQPAPPQEEEEEPYDPTKYNPDDPIYQDHLWLLTEELRYGDGARGAGVGYYSGYKPSSLSGNHTRAILLLHAASNGNINSDGVPEPAAVDASTSEVSLRTLANKLALSCECVALAPLLRGGTAQWPPERLAAEAWSALTYLNSICGAESLAVVAIGDAMARSTLGLLAEGALGAHAVVALCPGQGSGAAAATAAADLGRAARELPVPLLAVCGGPDPACATSLRESLALNSRLRGDFYVASLERAPFGDDPLPPLLQDPCADEALALMQSWVDRWCPEGLESQQSSVTEYYESACVCAYF